MKVLLRNPKRELDVPAPRNVGQLLRDLDVVAESVLVIRNDTLATHDERLAEDDVIEIRPVVSGGAVSAGPVSRPATHGAVSAAGGEASSPERRASAGRVSRPAASATK